MVRNIIIDNPDLERNEITLINENYSAGVTTLSVESSETFSANDLILIGLPSTETAEVKKISAIGSVTSIDLTSASSFAHQRDEPIIKLKYNQIKIYRSTDGGATFPLLTTFDVDYNSPQKSTEFLDATGQQAYIYRFTYYNSDTTTESDLMGDLKLEAIRGYITVEEFKRQTGLKVADELIHEAISIGANRLKRELYAPKIYRTGNAQTEHFIPVHHRLTFADADLSNTPIDADDFYAYEEDQPSQYVPGARTDVTSDITGVDVDRQVITFGTARPTGSKTLVIVYHETWEKLKFDTTQATVAGKQRAFNITLKQLNKLWAVNYIFENIPYHVLQRGISNWNLNGVSIPFDYDIIQKVIEDNNKRIEQIITNIEVPYMKFTTLRRPEVTDLRSFVSTLSFRRLSS